MENHNNAELIKAEDLKAQRSHQNEASVRLPTSNGQPYGSMPMSQNYGASSYSSAAPSRSNGYAPYPRRHHVPYDSSWGMEDSTASRYSGAPPAGMEEILRQGNPLPPGSEVHIQDETGEMRTYTVQYRMVTLSREEAKGYLDSLGSKP